MKPSHLDLGLAISQCHSTFGVPKTQAEIANYYNVEDHRFIQVISLWQPWASWIAWGWKTIETRTHNKFRNLSGKRIAIHAAKRWDDDWYLLASRYLSAQQASHTSDERPLPSGAIICTVFVTDSISLNGHHSQASLIDCEYTKRFGLVLRQDVNSFNPIPERGRQGIWTIPIHELSAASNPKTVDATTASGKPK